MFIVNMHMILCLMCCHLSVHDTRIFRSNIIASAISLLLSSLSASAFILQAGSHLTDRQYAFRSAQSQSA